MENDHEKRLVELEALISFQDQSIADLNDVIVSQQKQIDLLSNAIEKVQSNVTSLQEEPNDKPPPHY
jgi:uncharacterized coiled-coil protein SlyX